MAKKFLYFATGITIPAVAGYLAYKYYILKKELSDAKALFSELDYNEEGKVPTEAVVKIINENPEVMKLLGLPTGDGVDEKAVTQEIHSILGGEDFITKDALMKVVSENFDTTKSAPDLTIKGTKIEK
eukprot:CAMPEP_0197524760 /NCGR_PEP_ID=MMETSP1318-20131121/9782_1 /TAXON_ID=552666 /ORGANISM="Partenskyella glossopodia, Strain RCC365" /LENGTH=127 /DNA_ID=CAMNT_0043077781 /DNA_START=107 /DNA_END=490 /DNA_ORIENTATION=+